MCYSVCCSLQGIMQHVYLNQHNLLQSKLIHWLVFCKLFGASLSFRVASVGLWLCQTQSVKLIHPQRWQSAWHIQYYVTVHKRRSLAEIKPDTISL